MEKRWKAILSLTLITFVLSVILNLGSNSVLTFFPLTLSTLLLLFVVLIGVLFDIVGIAAAAGKEAPFHAMASNRLPGAKQAIWLVRNAHGVSTFCNDLVGDVAGTLSGAIGAGIVFKLTSFSLELGETLATTAVVALIAAITVGGKSVGKSIAISNSTSILLVAGRILASLERAGLPLDLISDKNKKR